MALGRPKKGTGRKGAASAGRLLRIRCFILQAVPFDAGTLRRHLILLMRLMGKLEKRRRFFLAAVAAQDFPLAYRYGLSTMLIRKRTVGGAGQYCCLRYG